ncbi:substrate-binding domain-containing protein [Nannocystis radixulma]|uniref:Substrate-binding domain-containing protein n=1 Tax=Nannocystis radixulma TaxID=2995305 RepID=A0ABT5BCW3_9BACT|nr:substrate-binding domain-containing protein [Nannocystis radixulma]MDC0671975.1 substrate-binding domain-containing protein [Nannocystis radixulma]
MSGGDDGPPTQLLGRLVAIVVTLVVAASLVVFIAIGGNFVAHKPAAPGFVDAVRSGDASEAECGRPSSSGLAVPVEVLYSDDKRAWLERAAAEFMLRCPHVQLRLTALPDIAAARSILAGEQRPTVWAPVDELSLQYLATRWQERSQEVVFAAGAPVSLVESPLVVLLWEDRLRALTAVRAAAPPVDGFWSDILCAGVPRDADLAGLSRRDMVPTAWSGWYDRRASALGRVDPQIAAATRRWGRVRFGHAAPTYTASGLGALVLMALDHVAPESERAAMSAGELADLLGEREDELRRWLRRCEGGLEQPRPSSRQLVDSMFRLGETGFDGVVVHESLVLARLGRLNADDTTEPRMIYPQPTLVARHPAVLMWPDQAAPEVRIAAEKWLNFLRGEAMQRLAILHGFRPASAGVVIRSVEARTNPFIALRRFGIELDVALSEAPRPGGRALDLLLRVWEDATGRS